MSTSIPNENGTLAIIGKATAEILVIIPGGMDLSIDFVMGLASVGSALFIQALTAAGFSPARP